MAEDRPVLLYVEDDENTAFLFKTMIEVLIPALRTIVVPDGFAALAFLHQQSPFKDALWPCLVVLDFHLPGITGLECLQQIRADPALHSLRVLFFTASKEAADREQALGLGALEFFQKPSTLEEFRYTVRSIHKTACSP